MINAIDGVLNGDPTYPAAFKRANAFWCEFFATHNCETDDELQEAIERAQTRFYLAMEESGLSAPLADEIMAVSCLGALYDDGFTNPNLARRTVDTMERCGSFSHRVRSSVYEARDLFNL